MTQLYDNMGCHNPKLSSYVTPVNHIETQYPERELTWNSGYLSSSGQITKSIAGYITNLSARISW